MEEKKYVKALEIKEMEHIEPGHTIKLYGEETTVKGFYGAYNEGLEKWETIIITEGRGGDPFERSLDVIEVLPDQPWNNPLPVGSGAAWIKTTNRLPGYETPVKWRDGKDHSHVTDGKIPLIHMAKPFLAGWEWSDETATTAFAGAMWVNANTRLPINDMSDDYPHEYALKCKNDGDRGQVIYESGNCADIAHMLQTSGYDVIYWLDESGAPAAPIYGPNEYPDLSSATPEVKAETISGLIELAAKEVLKMFYAFGLKTHIECTVINDPTKDEFDFIFRKKGTAAATMEEDACGFAEWMRLNCKSSQNGWVDTLGKWDTTKGWYELFKHPTP